MISVLSVLLGYGALLYLHPLLGLGAIVAHVSIMALAARR